MPRMGFVRYVEKLEEYIEREKPEELSVERAATILGVSPVYARYILKAVAEKRGWLFYRGRLYITYNRTPNTAVEGAGSGGRG